MALDLTELENKQKSQLRTPKRSNLKKMDPWDKFEPIKKEPSITKDKTTDTLLPIPEPAEAKNTLLTTDKTTDETKDIKHPILETNKTKKPSLTKDDTKDKTTDTLLPIPEPAEAKDPLLTTDKTTDETKDIKHPILETNKTKKPSLTKDKTTDKTKDTSLVNIPRSQLYYGQTKDITTETTDKGGTHPRTKVGTKLRTRLDTKNIPERTYSELSNLQQSIIKALYISCVQNSGTITQKISINYLINQTSGSIESIKRTIRRLMKENFLDKYEWKDGRGGWTKYELHPYLYQNLFGVINIETTDKTTDITADKGGTHPRTDLPSSSSTINNNINRTTTREEEEGGGQSNLFGLPPEWEQINFFGLNEKIRFGINQLKNIYNKKHLTASQCEASLEAFANDLDKNVIKSTKSPLSFLMGIMLKGEYNSIDPTFKTEEETVFEQQMQAKIEKANRMRELKQQAQEASCDLWIDELAKEDKDQIFAKLNVYRLDKMSDREKEVHLRQYHSDKIWPNELANMKKG